MSNNLLRKPRSMDNLLPPNYISDEGRFDLNLPRIRPAWLMNESIKSLDSKFPMVPAPPGSIVFYTTPLGEKLRQMPKDREFDLTDPLRPSQSYNCLHDEHLQVYFRSNDIRKRMMDEGFITDDGYVKCSLKEFNEHRQWVRKLKLDELHRERRQDEKQIEEARKERLERIALERDPELLEILKRRREKRREEAKIHQKKIKREQERLRKLEEIDRQRRENFVEIRRKTRDRIQIKRDLERERLRKKKSDDARQEHKIKLRIVKKLNKETDTRLKHLEERKEAAKEMKIQKLEEQWLRRKSWSVEHHDHQIKLKEIERQEFQQHVEERTARVARQRRHSEISYHEIAETNRRAFENQLERAEVFLAKLNDKKAEELKIWRKKFDAMQKSSHSTIGSNPSCVIKKVKQRTRRQSAWDLESCLLKDLGISEQDIKDNSYTKLGVISRTNELDLLGDTVGALGSLPEERNDEEQVHNKEFRFSIPTIVESLASLHEPSSDESDSESEYSFHIPSVFRFESLHDLPRISDSPEIKPNDHIPEGELRMLVKNYVQGILRQSADVLGVDIKFQERTPREQIPRVTDVKRIPKLKTKEIDAGDANMRTKVKEYLSGVLDKVENKMQISIKRPPEYEKIKQNKQPAVQSPVETSVKDIVDNKLHYHSKRNIVRLYLCKIVEDAAEQCQVNVKFPAQYQSFVKRLHRPQRKPKNKGPSSDLTSKVAGQHSVVLRAISSGTVILESAEKQKSMIINSHALASEIQRTAAAIDEMKNKYDKARAERLFHENLINIATRTVIQALHDAVAVVLAQRRNSDFFMSELPNLYLREVSPSSHKEQTVLLKQQRSRHRRESLKTNEIEDIPREVDFLSKSVDKKGGKHITYQQRGKQSEKNVTTNNSGEKTRSENKAAGKANKGTETKNGDGKKKGTEASCKISEKTGKESEDVEQEITISMKIESISDALVAKEMVEREPRIKEIESDCVPGESEAPETDRQKKTESNDETVEQTPGVKSTDTDAEKRDVTKMKCTESDLENKLGVDETEASIGTLSAKSPSLTQVTTSSGAVLPNSESDTDRPTAGSSSSAIFRMISMRETRENCDLSPEPSYVVLPTLTSSEDALLNSRMEQISKRLESTPSLPALSRSPSKDTHATSDVAADHATELVKLPSVLSVDMSRPPTPVRSLSSSSQVALPQIGGSNTSLVGNNEGIQETKSDKVPEVPHDSRIKTPPIVPTQAETAVKAPVKVSSLSKKTQEQQLKAGRPPARAKSEISRKPNAISSPSSRKGGQPRSTTAIVTTKAATPTQQKKPVVPTMRTQAKKATEQKKSLYTIPAHEKLAKSKSTGEAIIAAGRNSLPGSQSKRRPSEATVRTGNIAELKKNFETATKSTKKTSNTNVKTTSQKTESVESGSHGNVKTDVSQKSDTDTSKGANVTAKSSKPVSGKSSHDVKMKPTQAVQAKSTQDTHAKSAALDTRVKSTSVSGKAKPAKENFVKSAQDAHAKITQDDNAKSTNKGKCTQNGNLNTPSSKSSITTELKEKENSSKAAASKSKADKNSHEKTIVKTQESKDLQTGHTNAPTVKELKTKSKAAPEKDVKTTPLTAAETSNKEPRQKPGKSSTKEEPQTTPKPFPYTKDMIISSPESVSPTKFSPKPTPESSTPESEMFEKPQAMWGALVTSPDIDELSGASSPKATQKGSSPLLINTDSETDFYRKQHNIRKLEGVDDSEPTDENLDPSGNKRRIGSDNKPKVPKGKKKLRKPKDDHDGAKMADGTEANDRVTKVSDSKAKISNSKEEVSDATRNAEQNEAENANSKMSKTSVSDKRKKSLKSKESLDTDLRMRTNSKENSIQAISKTSQENSKISRKNSRSVSFSSTSQHFADAKQKKDSVDRLTKRRSSQKVAKKASNKELKKKRSSFTNEHVKGKTKSTTEVAAKVDSNRKVSNASISKTHVKTHRKSSKNVVLDKTASEAKTKSGDTQETCAEDTQEARVKGIQETSVDESQETQVQKNHVDNTKEIGMGNTQETHIKNSQESLVKDSQETRVDVTEETREGSDDNLRKTESDEEVVVQVYVPDEGQADVPVQVTEQISQESGDKAELSDTGRGNVVTTEGTPNLTKIDLKVFSEGDPESGVKRSSSRRVYGDNVVEKNPVNIVPRNSMDIIKGMKLTSDTKVTTNRSFHSKSNPHRAPVVPKSSNRATRRTPPEARAIKVSNFELPEAGQGGASLKPTSHGKAQMSAHRLASKMSTNLEKVDEGSALETGLSSKESAKYLTALNISKAGVKSQKSTSSTNEKNDNSQEKGGKSEENVKAKTEKKADDSVEKKGNEKTEALRAASNKSLQLLMKASSVCINSFSFAGLVQGTPLLNKESVTADNAATEHLSSASVGSNSSQPLVPSPPITAKPDMVSPRISRMMSHNMSNGSGKSRGSHGSGNEMSPTASMEIVKLASNSSHGWVSSPTSSVKFLPPIDARASKASNLSDDSSTKRRPRTAESAVSPNGSVGSGSSSGSQTKAAIVEIRRSGSGDLRIDGSSSGLIGVKSSSSVGSQKQTLVGF